MKNSQLQEKTDMEMNIDSLFAGIEKVESKTASTKGCEDFSIAGKALEALYQQEYQKAAELFVQLLDIEATNWRARFSLARCYQKLNQPFAAKRAFQYVFQNCPEGDLRHQSLEEMRSIDEHIQTTINRGLSLAVNN